MNSAIFTSAAGTGSLVPAAIVLSPYGMYEGVVALHNTLAP